MLPAPPTVRPADIEREGRSFALSFPDPLNGLRRHPIEPANQLLTAQVYFQAGQMARDLQLDDALAHCLMRGVREGLRQRRSAPA